MTADGDGDGDGDGDDDVDVRSDVDSSGFNGVFGLS